MLAELFTSTLMSYFVYYLIILVNRFIVTQDIGVKAIHNTLSISLPGTIILYVIYGEKNAGYDLVKVCCLCKLGYTERGRLYLVHEVFY